MDDVTAWLSDNWMWLGPIVAAVAPFFFATLKAIAKRTTTKIDDVAIEVLEEAAHGSGFMRLSLVDPSPRAPTFKRPGARTIQGLVTEAEMAARHDEGEA